MGVEDRNRACVEALERYVVACGGSADLVKNWTVSTSVRRWSRRSTASPRGDGHPTQATVETRKEGDTAGTYDVYYFDPAGKRYRSRAEVARAFFLAVPQRRTKAASTFGRTKKGRRRAAHAKRFAACTQHLRAALGRVLDDEQEAVDPAVLRKQHAEADDRGSKSVAAAHSKAERLLQSWRNRERRRPARAVGSPKLPRTSRRRRCRKRRPSCWRRSTRPRTSRPVLSRRPYAVDARRLLECLEAAGRVRRGFHEDGVVTIT